MIGIKDTELRQTRFFKDVFNEGWQGGHQEGRQEGLEAGRQAEARALLLRLLSKRFGPVGEDTQQRIAEASTAQLETWADRLLDAPNLAAVFDPH